MSNENTIKELLKLNEQLLASVAKGDWKTYAELCDPTITAFEPEARGQLAIGMDFHKFYFDLGGSSGPVNTTIVSPNVHLLGNDGAVVSYIRLVQRLDGNGNPVTSKSEETRVWHREGNTWRHVHVHRSVSN
jgi:calcium/calmodulin-dependent protein kinase (CaM kinase) II